VATVFTLSGELTVSWVTGGSSGVGEGVTVTWFVNVAAGVTGLVATGEEFVDGLPPLTGVECCTVLIFISNAPSTPASERITKTRSIMVIILAIWFFCDIL
jgi:hypothetical protein